MTLGEILKKIYYAISNFLKAIGLTILGIFIKPKEDEKTKQPVNLFNDNKNEKLDLPMRAGSESNLPDDTSTKANPHDETATDTTNDIVLELPKTKFESLRSNNKNEKNIIFTQEYICKLIEDELEHIYKEQQFKVEKADKEIKKRVKEFEEKIVPIIEHQITFYHLEKEEEVKKTVEKTVEIEIKEFPILPPLTIEVTKIDETPSFELPKKIEPLSFKPTTEETPKPILPKKKEPTEEKITPVKTDLPIYSLAYQANKELNLKEPPIITKEPITTMDSTYKIKTNLENQPLSMIKNTNEIPKTSIKDSVKNAAAVATLLTVKAATDILAPTENKESKKEDIVLPARNPELTNTNQQLDEIQKTIEKEQIKTTEQAEDLKKELEDKLAELEREQQKQEYLEKKAQSEKEERRKEEIARELKRQQEEIKMREEIAKSLIRDTEITSIEIETTEVLEDSKTEMDKEDFFDKDYERIEIQINRMLEDIENTRLRYGNKLSPKQKNKLEREESKLREAKDHISFQKNEEIREEQRALNDYITESEMLGLQDELKKIEQQNKEEVNKEFLRRMEQLQGMTQDQVAQADKRILFKRLNKASFLLEMGSILAFPFIRNRYFFNFTLGLIINNHFNFINAFWRRKVHKYEPADLSQIKQGQDALNGALDVTYKNIIELDQIEQDALARYPELANDPRFINQVTDLRIKLNNNYNKLMKKNKIMETYYGKAKHQVKILKKDNY